MCGGPIRRRFWAALGGAGASSALAISTLISRQWIEFGFGVDPDGGSGGLEWAIVVVTVVAAVVCFWSARVEWRRARLSEVTHHG